MYQNTISHHLISNQSLFSANAFLMAKKAPLIAYFISEKFFDSVNTWIGVLLDLKRYTFNHLTWKAMGYFDNPAKAELWQALFLGTTTQDSEIYLLFKHSGILHALAVSGSNLTMMNDQAQFVLNRFSRAQRFLIWTMMVVSYTFLVGDQPSLVRAAVMSMWTAAGQTIGRRVTFSWSLGWSVIVILLLVPRYGDSLSFQLSVAAVLGVCMSQVLCTSITQVANYFGVVTVQVAENTVDKKQAFWRVLYEALLATLVIQCWVSPLLLLSFGEISLRGVLISPVLVFLIPPLMRLVYWSVLALGVSSWQILAIIFFPVLAALKWAYLSMSGVVLTVLTLFDHYAPELLIRYQLTPYQAVVWYLGLFFWWFGVVRYKAKLDRTRHQLSAAEICM